MWNVGDRVRASSPTHGEMVGTILDISLGGHRPTYRVRWQTSRTGTIESTELGGRDDLHWEKIEAPSLVPTPPSQPEGPYLQALAQDPRLKSPHTRRAYASDLARFEAWRGEWPLSKTLVEGYVRYLQTQGKTAATIQRALAAIRWWARKVAEQSTEDPEHHKEAIQTAYEIHQVAAPRPQRAARRPALDSEAFDRLLQSCAADRSPAGVRDTSIFELVRASGLGREQIAALQVSDLQPTGDGAWELSIARASAADRTAVVRGDAARALDAWLALRGGGTDEGKGSLFLAITKGGRVQPRGLSGEALRQILNKRAHQAGLSSLSWPALRRVFQARRGASHAGGE